MSPENDKKLVEAHPLLYTDRYNDMRSTAMCWGFECWDGWYDLIWEASEALEKLIREYINKNPNDELYPRATQVKEKFGTLRFYVSRYLDGFDEIINKAEERSAVTCEMCGQPGETSKRGWRVTLCEECNKE